MPIDIEEERVFERKFLDREAVLALDESGYGSGQIALILGISQRYITAYKAGFLTRTEYRVRQAKMLGFHSIYEYHESKVRERTNPLTGKRFSSHTDYRNFLASRKVNPETGQPFKSHTELKRYQRKQREQATVQ